MLMSVLAFIKLKNISATHRIKKKRLIEHQNLVAALAKKVNEQKTNANKISNVAIQHQHVLNICIKMSFHIQNPTSFFTEPRSYTYLELFSRGHVFKKHCVSFW